MNLGRRATRISARGTPLTYEQLQNTIPALFHDRQGMTTMPVYGHLNTAEVVSAIMNEGWHISEAAQTGAVREWNRKEQKHYVRLRREEDFPSRKGKEYVPEIIVINAHNASSKLHLLAGLWRFVCENGLMVGQTVEAQSYYHRHGIINEILAGVKTITTTQMPMVLAQVKQMQSKQLTARRAQEYAEQAFALRWETGSKSVVPSDLNHVRREQDQPNDAWHVFNRVQENLMQGGFPLSSGSGRTVQPLTQVNDVVRINRALWDLALAA